MKVVVAHNRYVSTQPSGENDVVSSDMAELRRAGVQVVPFLRSSDDIASMPATRRAGLVVSPAYARAAQRELGALLRRERPDVLHLHNPYPLLSPWVIRTAHAYGVPVVHTLHNYRQTCVNGLHQRDGRDCHDCLGRAVPVPAIRHACYRGSRPQSAVMAATLALHRGTWSSVDRMLVLTPVMAGYARTLGIADERIVVRPNAVPDPGPPTTVGTGFLFAGRLSAEKGVGLLLDAWDRHPDGALGSLRIAGDGPLAALVRARAAAREDIEYLGQVAPAEVADQIRRAAVVVVPSTWDEVCPTVALVALAHGRPVLGCARGGLPWVIGRAGWVVEPTADALVAALPVAAGGAGDLAAAARARYAEQFTPQRAMGTLLDVYRDLSVSRTSRP